VFGIEKIFGVFLVQVALKNQNFVWHSRNGAPHLSRTNVRCPSSANRCLFFRGTRVGEGVKKNTKKNKEILQKVLTFFF
jgi:hypothetical protein